MRVEVRWMLYLVLNGLWKFQHHSLFIFLSLILHPARLFIILTSLFCRSLFFPFALSSPVLFVQSSLVPFYVPRLALPSQRLPLGLRLLAPAGVFPLREPPKAFDVKVRPIIHYCAFAPLTPIIRLVRLIRVCPLLPIDLANLVEGSIADPRSWHPAQGQVLIHALIALVLVHFGATWHFLQMKHRESCRH